MLINFSVPASFCDNITFSKETYVDPDSTAHRMKGLDRVLFARSRLMLTDYAVKNFSLCRFPSNTLISGLFMIVRNSDSSSSIEEKLKNPTVTILHVLIP